MTAPCIVILAAGKGTRMHSTHPKVLHPLAGRPLLEHVVQTALAISENTPPVVVTGFGSEQVRQQLAHHPIHWITQTEQLGTGHALQMALPAIPADRTVLVLYGDVPLVSENTLRRLIASTPPNGFGIVTATPADPTGLGRIVRDSAGDILRIVEEKDASPVERLITEINTGIYLIPGNRLHHWLPTLTCQNAQQEFYLTDLIQRALADRIPVHAIQPQAAMEIAGVNTRADLARLERYYQTRAAETLLLQGVSIADPHRLDIRGQLTAGRDVSIDINVVLEGDITLGDHVHIGPSCVLRNVTVGAHTEIRAHSVLEDAVLGKHCIVGPFARLRPGTRMDDGSLVGNFVETKKTHIGSGSKVNHLSYLGDCEVGLSANIGAGTITCNYDGRDKHMTHIGDRAFIGSNASLIAPVTVHADATIGAGTVLTRDAPAGKLTLARALQRTIAHWQRPEKKTETS